MNRIQVSFLIPGRTAGGGIDRSTVLFRGGFNIVNEHGCRFRRSTLDKPVEENTSMTTNRLLWIVQGLLAALFLFAGGLKWFVAV